MRHIPLVGRLPAPTRDDLAAAARAVYDAIVQGPRADGGVPATVADIDGRLQGTWGYGQRNEGAGTLTADPR